MTPWNDLLTDPPAALDTLLKLSGLLAAAWLTAYGIRRFNPRWRVVLWRASSLGVVLLPVAILLAPSLQIPISAFEGSDGGASSVVMRSGPMGFGVRAASSGSSGWTVLGGDLRGVSKPSVFAGLFEWMLERLDFLLLLAWILPAAALALWAIRDYRRMRGVLRNSQQAPLAVRKAFQKIKDESSCSTDVDLRCSPEVVSPLLVGLMRPVVLLPEQMAEPDRLGDLPSVFLHELAHLRSRDVFWSRFIQALSVLLWFHPLVWGIRRRHGAACEQVSDAMAAKSLGDTFAYSKTLARVALDALGQPVAVGGIPMAKKPEVRVRLESLRDRVDSSPLHRMRLAATLTLSALVLFGLGGLKVVEQTWADQANFAETAPSLDGLEPGSRVLRFDPNLSVGTVKIRDMGLEVEQITPFDIVPWVGWEPLAEARGNVVVPPGKSAALFISVKGYNQMSALAALRPDDLEAVWYWGYRANPKSGADDGGMKYLARLSGLRILNMTQAKVTDRGIRHLRELRSLERLALPSDISFSGLRSLDEMQSLKALILFRPRINNYEFFEFLSKHPTLEMLSISTDQRLMNDKGLKHLTRLPRLELLVVSGNTFGDQGAANLAKISSLKQVKIVSDNLGNIGLDHIGKMRNLEVLDLYHAPKITNIGVSNLTDLRSLKDLRLGRSKVSESALAHVGKMTWLEKLMIAGKFSDRGLANLSAMKNLRSLQVMGSSDSNVSDATLEHFASLQSLEELSIGGNGITDEGLLHIAKLPELKQFWLHFCPITDKGLETIATMKSLEELQLPRGSDRSGTDYTIAGLNHLNALKNLKMLSATGVRRGNGGAIFDLSALTELERLFLFTRPASPLRDGDLACMADFKKMKDLQMSWMKGESEITNAGIAHLSGLTSIDRLLVGGADLTDGCLSHLGNMKILSNLTLAGGFTDEGLRQLETFQSLSILKVFSPNTFNPALIESLQRNLPSLSMLAVDGDSVVKKYADRKKKAPSSAKKRARLAAKNLRLKNSKTKSKSPPIVGDIAPDFTVKTLDGKIVSLSECRGKPVLLYFWSTSCSPCRVAMPSLEKNYRSIRAKHEYFLMLGLCLDNTDVVMRSFVEKNGVTWPQSRVGVMSKIAEAYGVEGVPVKYLIGADGTILLDRDSDWTDADKLIENAYQGQNRPGPDP